MSAELRVLTAPGEAPEDPLPVIDAEAAEVRAALQRRDVDAVAAAFEEYRRTMRGISWSLRRRARRSERAVRAAAAMATTDAQAAEALTALHGHGNERRRNPGGLSDNELRLVECYRTLDPKGRAMIRELVDRLGPRR
jgi:hypothetical protein